MDLNLCPEALKPITHYLKIAAEHENRDIVVSYWCYIYSLQVSRSSLRKNSIFSNNLLVRP